MVESPETLPEVQAAARWWTELLRGPVINDSKNDYADVLKTLKDGEREPLSDEVLDKFYEYACLTIGTHVNRGSWRYDEPEFGSYVRAIQNDYSPDPALEAAAQKAGIRDLYFRMPWKTVMWVNPGEVKVSYGYGAPIEVIYSSAPVVA